MYLQESDPGNSRLHALDPRSRLLAATGAAICFSLMHSIGASILCLALGLLLCVTCCRSPASVLRRILPANLFILFIWATVPPSISGESLLTLGPLHYSAEGLRLALLVTLKCNAILLSFLALIDGLGIPLIGSALEGLRVPPKLVFLFLFTCRYIHVIGEEWQKLRAAAKLRGFRPRTSLHTYRTIANMLGLVFVNSFDRSHRIYEAMLLRGFRGSFHTVTELKAARADVLFSALFFCLLLGMVLSDLYLG